jgi:radical SAM-linked protein
MNKYRLKFSKTGKMRFVGHLDLLKIFQRAVKRSRLPIAYSKGFNPHQIMGFAVPLPLGMESIAECIDIELEEEIDTQVIKDFLTETLPTGMDIIYVRKFHENEKSAAALITAADYEITLDFNMENPQLVLDEMLSQEELLIEKKSKRTTKTIDIKKNIFDIKVVENDGFTKLKVKISTGSAENLKPDLLVNYIYSYTNREFKFYEIKYLRTQLYCGEKNNFTKLV